MFGDDDLTPSGQLFIPIVTILLPGIQFALAFGCKSQKPDARIGSRIIGILMLAFFPIGTILGLIILQKTLLKNEDIK